MKFLSVFSGVEAFSLAVRDLDYQPVGFAEIAPFPSAVLAHRFSNVRNFGDVRSITRKNYPKLAFDLLVGGSPCQSFSVTGKREGMAGESGLVLEYLRILEEHKPRWLVWENVPNVLSVDRGKAFGRILHAMEDCGYGVAWRVLDAQFFGVPQRRRRLFAVGRLGDWRGSAKVLLEYPGLQGAVEKARERGASTPSPTTGAGSKGRGGWQGADVVAPTLICGAPFSKTGNARAEGKGFLYRERGGDWSPVPIAETPEELVLQQNLVRRFTLTECERLQGMPDGWTDIPYKGKEHSPDTLRYKAIGNSFAVPVIRWIAKRILEADDD